LLILPKLTIRKKLIVTSPINYFYRQIQYCKWQEF